MLEYIYLPTCLLVRAKKEMKSKIASLNISTTECDSGWTPNNCVQLRKYIMMTSSNCQVFFKFRT